MSMGSMGMGTGGPGAIDQVRTGMHVVDADGVDVGTVKDVVMGDPEAVTAPGEGAPEQEVGAIDVMAAVAGGAELPAAERSRLLRAGYVLINLKGLFTGRRYAAGDEVADVEGDVVHLAVPSGRLVG